MSNCVFDILEFAVHLSVCVLSLCHMLDIIGVCFLDFQNKDMLPQYCSCKCPKECHLYISNTATNYAFIDNI